MPGLGFFDAILGWMIEYSKISPTYPWKIPQTLHQQFMNQFLSLWGSGEVWGIFPGYVGKIIELCGGW